MPANPERWSAILRDEIDGIQEREELLKKVIYLQLGMAIGKQSGASIERWATRREVPRKFTDVERLAQVLVDRGGLRGKLYEEFVVAGGHPNPSAFLLPVPMAHVPRDDHFVGRKEKLTEVLAQLHPGRITSLVGTGGVGKTSFVAELIHSLAPDGKTCPRFPDGIFYYEFYKHPSVDVALEEIARKFGKDEKPANPQAAARRYLHGKHALLILDGAEEADDLEAILRVRQDCSVLVVTRTETPLTGPNPIYLDVLPLEAAVAVLRSWSGDSRTDDQVAEQICEILGCLPLALRLAGRNLGLYFANAEIFLQTLAASPLALLDEVQRQHQSVPFLLQAMIREVSSVGKEVLGVVGVLSYEAFDLAAVATALALPEHQVRVVLVELVRMSLLKLVGRFDERYQVVHRLIHTYVADPDHGLVASETVVEELAGHYVDLANEQTALGTQGFAILDLARPHLLSLLNSCAQHEDWVDATSLVSAFDEYLHLQGHWSLRLMALEIGLTAAQRLGEARQESAILGNLGTVYSDLGQLEQAIECFQQALVIARQLDNRKDEALDLSNLGAAYSELGRIDEAMEYHRQALEIHRQLGDRLNEGAELSNIGIAYAELGDMEEAIDHYEQALAIAQETDDRQGVAVVLSYLALAYVELGWMEQAIDHSQQALAIAREIGDRSGECRQLGTLGNIYVELDQLEEARGFLEEALEIAEEIEELSMVGGLTGSLGILVYTLDQHDEAIVLLERALAIAERVGNPHDQGAHLTALGATYADMEQIDTAVTYYQRALALFEEIQSPDAEEVREFLAEFIDK